MVNTRSLDQLIAIYAMPFKVRKFDGKKVWKVENVVVKIRGECKFLVFHLRDDRGIWYIVDSRRDFQAWKVCVHQ